MTIALTFPAIYKKIEEIDPLAGELFKDIFESTETELINLSVKIPAIKSDEILAMQITTSLMAAYLSGEYRGLLVRNKYKQQELDRLELIGENLGLKIA